MAKQTKNYDCAVCGVAFSKATDRNYHNKGWDHQEKTRAAEKAAYEARQREEKLTHIRNKFEMASWPVITFRGDYGYRRHTVVEALIAGGKDKHAVWTLERTASEVADIEARLRKDLQRMQADVTDLLRDLANRGPFAYDVLRLSLASDILVAQGQLKALGTAVSREAATLKVNVDVAMEPHEWSLRQSLSRWMFTEKESGDVEAEHLDPNDAALVVDRFFAPSLDEVREQAYEKSLAQVRAEFASK